MMEDNDKIVLMMKSRIWPVCSSWQRVTCDAGSSCGRQPGTRFAPSRACPWSLQWLSSGWWWWLCDIDDNVMMMSLRITLIIIWITVMVMVMIIGMMMMGINEKFFAGCPPIAPFCLRLFPNNACDAEQCEWWCHPVGIECDRGDGRTKHTISHGQASPLWWLNIICEILHIMSALSNIDLWWTYQ